jgi:hypothetical protein
LAWIARPNPTARYWRGGFFPKEHFHALIMGENTIADYCPSKCSRDLLRNKQAFAAIFTGYLAPHLG